MKPIEEIDMAKVKECCKELNGLGVLDKPIKIVAVTNESLVQAFTDAIEVLAKGGKADVIPADATHLYNDIYADERDEPKTEGEGEAPAEETGEAEKPVKPVKPVKPAKPEKPEKPEKPKEPSNIDRMKELISGNASDDDIWSTFWPIYDAKGQTEDFCNKRIAIYKKIARKELGLPKE